MSMTTTNVHQVESITVETKVFPNFVNTEFIFTCKDGSKHHFAAFSSARVQINQMPIEIVETAAEQVEA